MSREEISRDLAVVSAKRVYFGHQSVGANIVAGLRHLAADAGGGKVNIISLSDTAALPAAFFAESLIGSNTKPDSKCDAFARRLTELAGRELDIALMKFCYVDIGPDTDIGPMFAYYLRTIDSLKAEHPSVTFVHVTVPLTVSTAWWKRAVGTLLGKKGASDRANARRNEFNAALLAHFAGEPVFDLAAAESTHPDGRRETFTLDGREYFALVPAYAVDGSHLNPLGQQRVAAEMIRALAKAPDRAD